MIYEISERHQSDGEKTERTTIGLIKYKRSKNTERERERARGDR